MTMALSSMFTIGSGASDAYDSGVQRDMDQDKERELIRQYQLQNQQSQVMNPLLAQHQQGLNDTLQAQLPGVAGNAASLKARGQVDSGTVDSDIASKRSRVLEQLDSDQLKQLKNMGEKYSQAGAYLASIPNTTTPAGNTRMIAAQKLAEQYGMSADSPQFQAIMQHDPEQLPAVLQKMGNDMAMSSGDFIQRRAMEQDRTKALMENAKTAAGSREEVARINHQNDLAKYSQKLQISLQNLSPEKRLAYLDAQKPDGSDPDQISIWQGQRADAAQTVNFINQSKAASLNPALVSGAEIPTNASNLNNYLSTNKPAPSSTPTEAPAGMKLVGTSKGRPVYEDSTGKRFLGK